MAFLPHIVNHGCLVRTHPHSRCLTAQCLLTFGEPTCHQDAGRKWTAADKPKGASGAKTTTPKSEKMIRAVFSLPNTLGPVSHVCRIPLVFGYSPVDPTPFALLYTIHWAQDYSGPNNRIIMPCIYILYVQVASYPRPHYVVLCVCTELKPGHGTPSFTSQWYFQQLQRGSLMWDQPATASNSRTETCPQRGNLTVCHVWVRHHMNK